MEKFDNLVILHISKYLHEDITNAILVSKKWFSIFHPFFIYLKPKIDTSTKLQYLFNQLKLGYKYDKYQTIYNVYYNINEFNKRDQKKLLNALLIKINLDKPYINFVPLKTQILIDKYLVKLI